MNDFLIFYHLTVAYSYEMDTLSDNYVHLTNYSINKSCEEYVANDDADACQGHKWYLIKCNEIILKVIAFFVGRCTVCGDI